MKSTTSAATIEKLREIFATHGLQQTVVSDNGTNFHPASNGQAERAVCVFKEGIEKMEGGSLKTKLLRFLLKCWITPHTTTGVPPSQLLMKRHLHSQLDLVRPNTND